MASLAAVTLQNRDCDAELGPQSVVPFEQRLGTIAGLDRSDFGLNFKVGKINVDEEPRLAAEFKVTGIPTIAAVHGSHLIGAQVGFRGKPALESLFKDSVAHAQSH